MRRHTLATVIALAGIALVGCDSSQTLTSPDGTQQAARPGGSGGQGSGQGSDGSGPPSGGVGDDGATVYVVHGINGSDLGADEALPVDVEVNGACVLEDLRFREIRGPLSLEPGSYDLVVRFAAADPCTGDAAVSADGVELVEESNVSVAAHLDASGAPTLTPFVNDVTPQPGRTRISARHAAAFGPVDVVVDGQVASGGLANGEQFGAFLRPGEHTVALTPAGDPAPVFEVTDDFRPFEITAAYAVGTPSNGTFEVLVQSIEVGPRAGDDEDDDADEGEEKGDDESEGDDDADDDNGEDAGDDGETDDDDGDDDDGDDDEDDEDEDDADEQEDDDEEEDED